MKTNQLLTKVFASAMFAGMMLFGSSVFAQVKIGTNPASIDAANNLEVESTAGNKVSVNKTTGKVSITDGSQGAGKILTSDASGVATWQALGDLKVPTIVFIGTFNTPLTYAPSNTGAVTSRTVLNPVAGYTGYDGSKRAYIIPKNGYYRVEYGVRAGETSSPTSILFLISGGLGIAQSIDGVGPGSTGARTLVETTYFTAGTEVYGSYFASGTGSTAQVLGAYLNVTYIPN